MFCDRAPYLDLVFAVRLSWLLVSVMQHVNMKRPHKQGDIRTVNLIELLTLTLINWGASTEQQS